MKKVEVKVCVCTACVMNGSVEIMESVESLRHLREQMEDGDMIQGKRELIVATDKALEGFRMKQIPQWWKSMEKFLLKQILNR